MDERGTRLLLFFFSLSVDICVHGECFYLFIPSLYDLHFNTSTHTHTPLCVFLFTLKDIAPQEEKERETQLKGRGKKKKSAFGEIVSETRVLLTLTKANALCFFLMFIFPV